MLYMLAAKHCSLAPYALGLPEGVRNKDALIYLKKAIVHQFSQRDLDCTSTKMVRVPPLCVM